MPYAQVQVDPTRGIVRLLFAMMLVAAIAGCSNAPTTRGIPWWPQGPGNASDVVPQAAEAVPSSAAPAMRQAETVHSSFAQPANSFPSVVRYGDLYFVSGQIADDPASQAIVAGGIEAQVHAAMGNVIRILEGHGLTSSNIVSICLYLQDVDHLPQADRVLASYFRRSLPARSVVSVNGLPRGSLVEISVIAGK